MHLTMSFSPVRSSAQPSSGSRSHNASSKTPLPQSTTTNDAQTQTLAPPLAVIPQASISNNNLSYGDDDSARKYKSAMYRKDSTSTTLSAMSHATPGDEALWLSTAITKIEEDGTVREMDETEANQFLLKLLHWDSLPPTANGFCLAMAFNADAAVRREAANLIDPLEDDLCSPLLRFLRNFKRSYPYAFCGLPLVFLPCLVLQFGQAWILWMLLMTQPLLRNTNYCSSFGINETVFQVAILVAFALVHLNHLRHLDTEARLLLQGGKTARYNALHRRADTVTLFFLYRLFSGMVFLFEFVVWAAVLVIGVYYIIVQPDPGSAVQATVALVFINDLGGYLYMYMLPKEMRKKHEATRYEFRNVCSNKLVIKMVWGLEYMLAFGGVISSMIVVVACARVHYC